MTLAAVIGGGALVWRGHHPLSASDQEWGIVKRGGFDITIPCNGEHNIPDGEIFTCPVRDSVNGTIAFNAETLYRGRIFSNIRLTFKDGKIVDANQSCSLSKRLASAIKVGIASGSEVR